VRDGVQQRAARRTGDRPPQRLTTGRTLGWGV
jgi:hypothetical protein